MLLEDSDTLLKLLANLDLIRNNKNSESSSICDIYDGELYKKLCNIKCTQFKTLTFNFNTDHAALFHSSKLSIWPVQLIINEFPTELRFKTFILAALWLKTHSFLLLVRSVYILLQTDISEENLLQCELDLVRFVGECEILYGEEVITFNMHSVLH
ncbi:hypothetical protein ALC57_09446 [Trachymyrmex cornetzi]|uniref:Uncharacterized protein n=1 Tax=Trachymyrmex cornetzi TaxID=471704 RepID=A0A151J5D4_9HYME|nr:hypothetical protein ALC57_09446 [Trachymyrmex cornetzi]